MFKWKCDGRLFHDWEYTQEIETQGFIVRLGHGVLPEHPKKHRYRTCLNCGRKEELKRFEGYGFHSFKYFDVLQTPQNEDERKSRIRISKLIAINSVASFLYPMLHISIYGYVHLDFFIICCSIFFLGFLLVNKILFEYNKVNYQEPEKYMIKT